MEILNTIARWLSKQHVLTYCVGERENIWCANAFYIFDSRRTAFYLLSDSSTRHGMLIGNQATVAGTVSGQPRSVALIRGVQFVGQIKLLEESESVDTRKRYNQRFPIAKIMSAPVWEIRLNELKMTDNTLGFSKKLAWKRES